MGSKIEMLKEAVRNLGYDIEILQRPKWSASAINPYVLSEDALFDVINEAIFMVHNTLAAEKEQEKDAN
jgi:hypothetical protein